LSKAKSETVAALVPAVELPMVKLPPVTFSEAQQSSLAELPQLAARLTQLVRWQVVPSPE
jgi:hypothetical protein